uniref:Uncharacterized protein n=1 Tax=Rhizophora mucronata TaxID=61149 RepID=A0A2P2KR13_RHIMU
MRLLLLLVIITVFTTVDCKEATMIPGRTLSMKHRAHMPRPPNNLFKLRKKALSPTNRPNQTNASQNRSSPTDQTQNKTLNFATNQWIPDSQFTKETKLLPSKRKQPSTQALQNF